MKQLTSLFFFFLVFSIQANEFLGDWKGSLSVNGIQLPLVLHINEKNKKIDITIDSPLQKVTNIVTLSSIVNDSISIQIPTIGASYKGQLVSGKIHGVFIQFGQNFALDFERMQSNEAIITLKPQTPTAPFPYTAKEVFIKNQQTQLTIGATVTIPKGKGPFPVVVLVSGSGAQNRDCELLGHAPFWVIADHLSRNGIAVVRYDDRGVAQSQGDFASANTFDFANDAEAVVDYIKKHSKLKKSKVGIYGHSEGGMVAEILASKSTHQLDFVILAAAPGKDISDLMIEQVVAHSVTNTPSITENKVAKIAKSYSEIFKVLQTSEDDLTKRIQLRKIMLQNNTDSIFDSKSIEATISVFLSNWYQTFIKFKPSEYLQQIKIPVLAFNGDKDVQVSVSNLDEIETYLRENNPNLVEIHRLKNLNHLFQSTTNGSVSEYAQLSETFNPDLLQLITTWILKQ